MLTLSVNIQEEYDLLNDSCDRFLTAVETNPINLELMPEVITNLANRYDAFYSKFRNTFADIANSENILDASVIAGKCFCHFKLELFQNGIRRNG